MRILWITNILFPEAESHFRGDCELKASGGWMLGAANELIKNTNVDLFVASVSPLVNKLEYVEGKSIKYYIIPLGYGNMRENHEYDKFWQIIEKTIVPDVVHIHGTEFSHGYSYMTTCDFRKVVISIQGLTSVYSKYYHYGMTISDILKNITLKDIIRGSIFSGKKQFSKRGDIEKKMLKLTNHIIGRTSWDKAHVWSINPSAHYHFCNEILRDEFYLARKWNYKDCVKHSIFVSQANYPIKGLHQLLKAMPIILSHFPNTTIKISGANIVKGDTFGSYIRMSGYGKYINSLINKYNLKDRVHFLGNLNSSEMINEYLSSNVFVCPSSIENSPNSLGEAQILGVPCVTSYVGGIPDLMAGNEEFMYRFEEIEMLAYRISNVFSLKDKVNTKGIMERAIHRHSKTINTSRLVCIYSSILDKGK